MRQAAALLALALAACAAPQPAPVESAPPAVAAPPVEQPAPVPSPAPSSTAKESVAIAGLMDSARTDAAAGRLAEAAATLERALRIEPRNPRLWQELARVRLQQGDFAQAESTAQRSNSWAGSDSALRAENARIIEQARAQRR
ncbi:MAG TPA: tetratricopeptide repeat protein [Burkholderiales bacterium]|jgi:Flp pilus assembly protein TadD|nr:tetratricopeptide repeat protein [Burkholderiales bacterium]